MFGEENGYVEENWFEQDGSMLHKSRVAFAWLQAKVWERLTSRKLPNENLPT